MQLPSRSTLAAGLTSVIGWAIVTFALPALGVPSGLVTPGEAAAVVGAAAAFASHVVPNSLKDIATQLNTDVENVAALVPVIEDDYPPDKVTGITTDDR